MKPNEVYNWTPITTTKELSDIDDFLGDVPSYDSDKNEKIEIKYYVTQEIDLGRGFYFCSVWFDEKPVMICETAGRGGRDYQNHFITDKKRYREMQDYVRTVLCDDYDSSLFDCDPDDDIDELGSFYNCEVKDFYSPEPLDTKYKVGDVVIAEVPKNHLSYMDKKTIKTKVLIDKVRPHNPYDTYSGIQIARKWTDRNIINCEEGTGSIGAHFNESQIVKE